MPGGNPKNLSLFTNTMLCVLVVYNMMRKKRVGNKLAHSGEEEATEALFSWSILLCVLCGRS